MEGTLLVPPDRGTILGRAVWKSRYIVIGPLTHREESQSNLSLSQAFSTGRIKDVSTWGSKSQPKLPIEGVFLSIYKGKDDWDAIQQYPISCITDCQVQQIAHRSKQSHVHPTLQVHIVPDPATEKLRKRRSSRTAGLTSSKESGPTTLWFRWAEDSLYGLGDWARYIQSLIQPEIPGQTPISPISPTSPPFINPFAAGPSRDAGEYSSSTASTTSRIRSKFQPKSSGQGHQPARDATSTYQSESPSLRSRRSDLSSHASSMNPGAMGFTQQHYTTVRPSDLPSPATTVEYPDQFIEGWTSAQGRSSTLSSPVRGRASVSSSHGQGHPSIDSSSPPIPRETILDRAFQLRCIPGSENESPGEDKLTSLARFEALMREAEDRSRAAQKQTTAQRPAPLKSTWEEDDESDDDEFGREIVDSDSDDDESDGDAFEEDIGRDGIGPTASAALQFISNRHSSTRWPQSARLSHYSDSGGLSGGPSILRPHTAHSRLRPAATRTSSQPYIPSAAIELSTPPPRVPEEGSVRESHEKRRSTSDVRHLNFNEFTKRMSSSSSLLLVQTNTSTGGSSCGSSEYDGNLSTTPRGNLSPRGSSLAPAERDERCRWRGSVGVFGSNEGGFL
ncbi:hypothetical protein F5Y15DRAFT_329187 [Xylariaceae sp. FL0016]|nr:hypothetical protein F5Y15DRAFT_329187 [Xylariaceae sp. FL0016]